MKPLYLTAEEIPLFEKLPAGMRDEWEVKKEEGLAFESFEVLKIRAGMARFDSYPALKELTKKAAAGEKIDAAVFAAIPQSVLPELFFTIGARGISMLIAALLSKVTSDEDIAGVEGLSAIRHDILKTNASISYA